MWYLDTYIGSSVKNSRTTPTLRRMYMDATPTHVELFGGVKLWNLLFLSMQHHPPTSQVWVFGMTGVSHEPALGFMPVVPSRDTAALFPIYSTSRSIIHSDQWAAHNGVQQLGNVESYWNRLKTKLKRMKGCRKEQLLCYLDEFMWRECYCQSW